MQSCKAACCSCISAGVATSAAAPPIAMDAMDIVSVGAAIDRSTMAIVSSSAATDRSATAIAAIRVAIDHSVPDAVLEANQRAERYAMGMNDRESWIAQNGYTTDRQLFPNGPLRTWRAASGILWNRMWGVHLGLGMALRYVRQQRLEIASSLLQRLQVETEDRDDDSDDDGEVPRSEAEASEMSEQDVPMEDMPDEPMSDELESVDGSM